MTETHIVGVDVAPGKDSTVCRMTEDGTKAQISDYSADRLKSEILNLSRQDRRILLCWDAPLTGPNGDDPKGHIIDGSFTKRPIEKFFTRKDGKKVPKGVSVRAYSGCPHWAITRYMLGLPRVGQYDDREGLPFRLIHRKDDLKASSKAVVEVHPAVALWLWLSCPDEEEFPILYKRKKTGSQSQREVRKLYERVVAANGGWPVPDRDLESDDELDSYIAFLLGYCLVEQPAKVMMLGDSAAGSWLLPQDEDIAEMFQKFRKTAMGKNGR